MRRDREAVLRLDGTGGVADTSSRVATHVDPTDATDALRMGRNQDGGWAYYPSKASRLEPTAWGLLALRSDGVVGEAASAIRTWPVQNGLLLERSDGEPNYAFHAVAMLAMEALGVEHPAGRQSLLDGLVRVKGIALEPLPGSTQDNTLQAWSWMDGTFSWVEPTAWCVLCLKKLRRAGAHIADAERLDVAERMLVNRACAGGGWNYGNADVLGQDLRAYVPTTAAALLAMQDRRTLTPVQKGLAFLEAHATAERSATALGLAAIALRVYGRSTTSVEEALHAQLPIALDLRNHAALAIAACALHADTGHAAFLL